MKHLVITETNRIAYGLTRKIAIMPRVFTIDSTLEPGVFDIGVKAEEWYTDVVFELSTYTRRPANKENAEKKEKSEKK